MEKKVQKVVYIRIFSLLGLPLERRWLQFFAALKHTYFPILTYCDSSCGTTMPINFVASQVPGMSWVKTQSEI